MECKCCGEVAEFKIIEEGLFRHRYRCSNCNKYFKADSELMRDIKYAKRTFVLGGLLLTGTAAAFHAVTGNEEEAIATIANYLNLAGSNDNSIV